MKTKQKLKLTVATTPHGNNKTKNVEAWYRWAKEHFASVAEDLAVRFLVAMPGPLHSAESEILKRVLPAGDVEVVEMDPGSKCAGEIFSAAVAFGINRTAADYVLHVPIDLTYGVTHENDVQDNIVKMLSPILSSLDQSPDQRPDLLIVGDYNAVVWQGGPKPATFKAGIEAHVSEQLDFYYSGLEQLKQLGLKRPRSEFFLIGREFYRTVISEGRWTVFDPVPQIIVFALRKNFRVVRVGIGNSYVDDRFTPRQIQAQVLRTAQQISMDWIRWQPTSSDATSQMEIKLAHGNRLAFQRLKSLLELHESLQESKPPQC